MTHLVARTCTEISRNKERHAPEPESKPLSAFRSEPAYVLLGDPGLGKTTALERECQTMGASAHFVTARDFLALDPNRHAEWREKMLCIDGLDEVRTGSSDVRTSLDAIRGRLDSLGCPSFRLSCREADWLGDNDRRALEQVAPDGRLTILRLDPLTDSDVEQILAGDAKIDDPQAFIEEAGSRGIDSLLANPQTLNLLANVVGGKGEWPESRLETFELACRQMVTEHNQEHSQGIQQPPQEQLLDAAGYLCAAQLVTGAVGFSLGPAEVAADYIALDDCDHPAPVVLKHALATKLFKAVDERHLLPVHRHVAEFLGARHLARRITEGLSARRVQALISGPDGVVVTEMRGISGWLAAQCIGARSLLIERDPIGVALYGDIQGFSTEEKGTLLRALGRPEVLGPLWREVTWFEMGAAFGALASPDMVPVIDAILSDPSRDTDHEGLVQFVLTLLWQGSSPASLAPRLLSTVRDQSWPPRVTSFALDSFLRVTDGGANHTAELRGLLGAIHEGAVLDPDHEMRGALLTHLYPREVSASSVWDHLTERGNSHLVGHYWSFWNQHLLSQSSDQDVGELLDNLLERRSDVLPALESHNWHSLPTDLLAQGLEAQGDGVLLQRLSSWLRAAAPSLRWGVGPDQNDSQGRVRGWLEKRPEIQKAVLLEGLKRCPDDDGYDHESYEAWGTLHRSSLPSDFGLWCLNRAVDLAPVHSRAAEDLLLRAFRAWREQGYDKGLSLPVLTDGVRGHPALEARLSALVEGAVSFEVEAVRDGIEQKEAKEEQAREREDDIAYVRSHAEALRENRAPLGLLGELGRAYFLFPHDWGTNASRVEALSESLGDDQTLVEAALAGLRGTLWRNDVPDSDEIVRLKETSMRHRLDFAVLAALDILQREDPTRLKDLTQGQIETGLTFYYCTPAGFAETPAWVEEWTARVPELVADVAARCTLSAIRHGDGYSPALETIRRLDGHPSLRQAITLKLLGGVPAGAGLKTLGTLDSLLWTALAYPDRSALLDRIGAKLSLKSMGVAQRVRWLAAGAIAAPEAYGPRLRAFVGEGQRRVRALAAFFDSRDAIEPLPFPSQEQYAPVLEALISLMGRSFARDEPLGFGTVTIEMTTAGHIRRLIQQVASLPGEAALQALDSLVSDPGLVHWHDHLERARDDQRVVYRDAAYRHPDLGQFHRALKEGEPANVGDLAALLHDRLTAVASGLRTTNTDDWRQYWNEDPQGQPKKPKHEESCRDALLSQLRGTLPDRVDAQPEGQHSGDKRSDIRVAYGGFSVPVEIKKDTHRYLWSAIRNQLIEQYSRDIDTGGYGIYLVFWFGEGGLPPPPTGTRPTNPRELQERLAETLTAEEARKIDVLVVDVSPVP